MNSNTGSSLVASSPLPPPPLFHRFACVGHAAACLVVFKQLLAHRSRLAMPLSASSYWRPPLLPFMLATGKHIPPAQFTTAAAPLSNSLRPLRRQDLVHPPDLLTPPLASAIGRACRTHHGGPP